MAETYGIPGAEAVRLRTNGIELDTIVAGPADGPLVVLLHGFPESSRGWRRQVGPLAAAGLRVAAPDQRGYGLSDKPRGVAAYAIGPLADDVLGLADAFGRERFAVVGHDWGAAVAWHLAARDPGRVERAAVLNGVGVSVGRDYARARPGQTLRSWYIGLFQAPALPELALRADGFARLRSAMTRSSRPGTFTEEDFRRYGEAWARPARPSARSRSHAARASALVANAPPRTRW
jgi:pimeloyl-ACP methyl ester carboxylesterase